MTQKSCAVGMRNAKLGNHRNKINNLRSGVFFFFWKEGKKIRPPSPRLNIREGGYDRRLQNSVKTLPYIIFLHNFLVESDNNSESRFLDKFFRKCVFKVGTF